MDPATLQLSLLVPRDLVKTLKDTLEKHKLLDKSTKIRASTMASPARRGADTSISSQSQGNGGTTRETETETDTYVVPTTMRVWCDATPDELERVKTGLLKELSITLHEDAVHVTTTNIITTTTTTSPLSQPKPTALTAPIHSWLTHDLPPTLLESLHISISTLLDAFPTRYTIYPPLLLLPSNTFTTPPWPTLAASLSPSQLDRLYARLCASLRTTHVAINAPIPAHVSSPSPLPSPFPSNEEPCRRTPNTETENILRSPIGLRPLHGSFGPSQSPPHNPPTPAAFASALWVSTRQNKIYQTWAPLHTMFSRGNVSEKARVLRFASAPLPATCSEEQQKQQEQQERRRWGGKCTAMDLYAGIGYFAFSYAKSEGVARVLGWEVSGWSVEGLRRGAVGNGWGVRVVGGGGGDGDDGDDGEEGGGRDVDGWKDTGEKIVVFRENNLNALRRIERMREKLPPVRHVNCGLLPTSRGSWEVAVGALDPVEGGWIHAHENIAVKDIGSTKDEIVERFRKLVNDERRKVECQHLERVKTYAPGVMHCVLDIHIPPAPSLTAAATSTATSPPPSAPAQVDYNTVQST